MFEIGSSLRQARQHRRLELADVERATHIRVKYLGALEDDRFEVLPSPAYARGFLRTYAEFLGLDGNLLVDEFNTHFAPPEEEQPPIQPPSLCRAGSSLARPVTGILVVLVAGTLVVWQLGFSSPRRESLASASPLPQTPKPHATSSPAKTPTTRPVRRPAGKPTLVVVATGGPCWVVVREGSAGGAARYEGTLEAGVRLTFRLDTRLWVRLGAPWNATVTIRGKRVTGLPHAPANLTAA